MLAGSDASKDGVSHSGERQIRDNGKIEYNYESDSIQDAVYVCSSV